MSDKSTPQKSNRPLDREPAQQRVEPRVRQKRQQAAAGRRAARVGAVRRSRFGSAARPFLKPFSLAVLACLVLAGWALWSGGLFDSAAAREVRTSSVYAAPGVTIDTAAAKRVIGNRRLVVMLMRPGADLSKACDDVQRAAAGTIVVLLDRQDDDLDSFGCSAFKGSDGKYFGNAYVAESEIVNGVEQFADDPLEAVKVIAVNFDSLVEAGVLPGDARTISPSFPRFLVAIAALAAVVVGSAVLFVIARRAGRIAAARRARLDRATDSRSVLSAATAAVAQQIIDLDTRYATVVAGKRRRLGGLDFLGDYRRASSEYVQLLDDVAAADRTGETDFGRFTARADELSKRLRTLAR